MVMTSGIRQKMKENAGGYKSRVPTPDQLRNALAKHRGVREGKKALGRWWNLHKVWGPQTERQGDPHVSCIDTE